MVVSVSIRNIRCEYWFLSECIGAVANKYQFGAECESAIIPNICLESEETLCPLTHNKLHFRYSLSLSFSLSRTRT